MNSMTVDHKSGEKWEKRACRADSTEMISSALKTGGQAAYMQDSLKFHRKRNSHLKGEQKMSGVACKIKLQQNQQEHHLVLLEPSAKTELKPGESEKIS